MRGLRRWDVLGRIRKGCAAKLTGACQKLQLIIETVAIAAARERNE